MNGEEKARLQFKRQFILENLERVKIGNDRVLGNCDLVKTWVVTVWLGTIAYSIERNWAAATLLVLLLVEVVSFYLLESYFRMFSAEYGKRIRQMEDWIMTATDELMLSLNGPLALVVSRITNRERVGFFVESLQSRHVLPFYGHIAAMSIAIILLKVLCRLL